MDDLYREIILDHYKNPHNFGTLKNPTVFHEENNPFCGDRIRMEIKVQRLKDSKTQIIEDIKFSGVGCAISIASASMLTEKAKGAKVEDLRALKKDAIVELVGTQLTPTRLKCALLPLEVLQKTLTQHE